LPSEIPDTRYARADGGAIAYQSFGEGERNLVVVPPFVSHVEMSWEHPPYGEFMDRMAEIGRVTVFDKRGNGLSDALPEGESLEQRADDILAVMDAVGAERASLFGISEGAAMAALVAATRPERVDSLVLYGGIVRMREGEDFYSGAGWHVIAEEMLSGIEEAWGEGISLTALAPGRLGDERFRRWWGRFERAAAGPKMARDAFELDMQLDVRSVLSAITCPTLVLHRTHDVIPMEQSHYLASHIPDARMVELEGENHWPWLDDTEAVADEIEEFLTGARRPREPDRILATVLFTDIVASTQRAAELGDEAWREVLRGHDSLVREQLQRHSGREVKATGDGFLATFDGPARGVRCARAITEAVRPLGVEVRAGLHTGECELLGNDVGGLAVHIGARVSSAAEAGEVLVSSTVKDLVLGSGIEFSDRGAYDLKGVPGEWRLFSASSS
jgi:pimeloyl-ACP methyl ester carboxylesterase